MGLQDKIINLLGDSITEGAGASSYEHCYASLLEQSGYFKKVRNYGIGGTRIAPNILPTDPKWDQDFCGRAPDMEPADLIIVFGGTNDFGHGDAPFGELTDRTTDSFCGSYHVLLEELENHFPQAGILVITPLHRDGEENPCGEGTKQNGKPLRQYVDAILEIAGMHEIEVLNLFDAPPFPVSEEYLADGLHPNDKGHEVLAETILTFLKNMQ